MAAPMRWREIKRGERVKRAPHPIYYQHPAAGGLQGPQFLHPEDHAPGPAALRGRGGEGPRDHRPYHLSAYRFYPRGGGSGRCGPGVRAGSTMGKPMWRRARARKRMGLRFRTPTRPSVPTDIRLTPVVVKESFRGDLFRLYQLIWKRFTASRMKPAVYETTNVKISGGEPDFYRLIFPPVL